MNNHWIDLKNAKVFLIEGSNAAENHSMSMKWIMRAKANGAKVIHVDPRFTRTSAVADIYARIRPGSDVAFLNSITNYLIQNKLYDEEFVKIHTNSLFLINDKFSFKDGLFSGYDSKNFKYDNASWSYVLDGNKRPVKAASLDDPRTVFSKLKEHVKRYDFGTATKITGIPSETIKLIADTLVENRPGAVLYALGMTQHTIGAQNIKAFTILQMLLGNMGKPGSGIQALRGEPNVQGATDMAVLFHILPGYLAVPNHNQPKLDDWRKNIGTFRTKFLVSLLKAWYGDSATEKNDFGYGWLPKKNGGKNYSIYRIFETAIEGTLKFFYVLGQNPLVTSPNLNVVNDGLKNMDMLVVQDLFMTETAAFWERPGNDPSKIKTEVIFLPAASTLERDGSLANSGRMLQWRYKALEPKGDSKPDLEILNKIFMKVRELYKDSKDAKDDGIKLANWNYPEKGMSEAVLKEINGFDLKTGKPLVGIGAIQGDGSTSCGNWLYAGVYAGGKNLSKRKDNKTDPSGLGIFPGFAWTWPGNMHVLYNRASCDANGKPFDPKNAIVWWDEDKKKWTGWDTPDVPKATDGPGTPNGLRAFRMTGEGVGRLFAAPYKDPDDKMPGYPRDGSSVLADGPFPEHYEPVESPSINILHPDVAINPGLKYPRMKSSQLIGTKDKFPVILSTSSMAEHWCAGTVTRNIPWLNELVPEPTVELSEKFAAKLGIKTGDKVEVQSARGKIVVKGIVTKRMDNLVIDGKDTPIVWMPYNWGFKGLSQAASTNLITIDAGDPNTWIQESKACLVNIKKA